MPFGFPAEFFRPQEYLVRSSRWGCRFRTHELGPSQSVTGNRVGLVNVQTVVLAIDPRRRDRFDVGGTSTDVSRFDGKYEIVYETTTAGISIQSPQLDINTVRFTSKITTRRQHIHPSSLSAIGRWQREEVPASLSVTACFKRVRRAPALIPDRLAIEKEGRWR